MKIIVYDQVTGGHNGFFELPESQLSIQPFHQQGNYVEVDGDLSQDQFYFPGGVVTERPAFQISADRQEITADGVSQAIISGVPVGTMVSVGDVEASCDDGEVVFVTDTEGTHTLHFSMFPYRDTEITINAS